MEQDISKEVLLDALHLGCSVFLPKYKIFNTADKFIIYGVIPELELTNTYGKTHLLKEILLTIEAFSLEDGETSVPRIEVTSIGRGTQSIAEYTNHYVHSHVSGDNICYGRGPLAEFAATYANQYFVNPEIAVQSYLANIIEFLKYESTDTVPYKRISNLYLQKKKIKTIPMFHRNIRNTLELVNPYNFEVSIEDGYLILENADIEAAILPILNSLYLVVKDSMGCIRGAGYTIPSRQVLYEPFNELLGREEKIIEYNYDSSLCSSGVHPHILALIKSTLILNHTINVT